MIEPIERVAKAMAECEGRDYYEARMRGSLKVARAAIEAMREPTEEMIEAGADLMIGLVLEWRERMVAKQIWQVMHAKMLAKAEEAAPHE
jgi:hypothetical protein